MKHVKNIILPHKMPVLHYNVFVSISIILTGIGRKGTGAMKRGEPSMPDAQ